MKDQRKRLNPEPRQIMFGLIMGLALALGFGIALGSWIFGIVGFAAGFFIFGSISLPSR